MPYLGLNVIPTFILFVVELWIILPSETLRKEDFRRKLRRYMAYVAWVVTVYALKEVLSYLFENIPLDWQFLIAFVIAAYRELDFYVRCSLLNKMTGDLDEESIVLLTITVNSLFGLFLAT